MPLSLCCVPKCSNRGGHSFPQVAEVRKLWINAIRRDAWQPKKHSVVCKLHFVESDYSQKTSSGTTPLIRKLKTGAVPSIFDWSKPKTKTQLSRISRLKERLTKQMKIDLPEATENREPELCDIGCEEEVIETEPDESNFLTDISEHVQVCVDSSTQTSSTAASSFCVERFEHDSKGLLTYSGVDSYAKFCLVLNSLGEAAYDLDYYYHGVHNISVENQLFLTLIKLRLHWTNCILADQFGISETTVVSVFITWINFMYHQWKEIDLWPGRDLVRYFSPEDFFLKFPKTRVVIDGTECPIQKPKPPLAQQATFSTYKNKNTIKILVGGTPGGLISYVSDAFGGSASDRQIVERSVLLGQCDPGDSIMADKGFNVQDLFAPHDVQINIPSFFNKKNRLDGKTVQSDRAISSKRVHIERLIGLLKTYKIMREPLTMTETNLATEICFVCCMLTNFKAGIVPKSC